MNPFLILTEILLLVSLAIGGGEVSYGKESETMKAGTAKIVITPSENMWLSGYAARTAPSEGKEHDLYAKAIALQDSDGQIVVFVSTDLIGLTADLTSTVSDRIRQKHRIDRKRIMFTSSHTHCGPVIRHNLEVTYGLNEQQWNQVVLYTKELEEKLVDVIDRSISNLEPVTLYRGLGEAKFAINRRQFFPDGVRIGVNPIGPVDHDVPVMKAVDANDQVKAVLFGYACHNTTLSYNLFCGDYAGFAQIDLEEAFPNACVMFFSGCAGDQNPEPRREVRHAKNHGVELSLAVQRVIQRPMVPVKGPVKAAFTTIDLPLTPAPTRTELEAQLQDSNPYIQRRAKGLLKTLDEHGSIRELYPYPIQVWSFGPSFDWIALAGEVVVDYSLLLKHRYGRDRTWVTAYANDVFAYIPSIRVLLEGGYEADHSMIYYGLHGPWKPDIESMIVNAIHGLIAENHSALN